MITEAIDSWEQRRTLGTTSDAQPAGPLEPGQIVNVHAGAITQKLGTNAISSTESRGVGIVLSHINDAYLILINQHIVIIGDGEVERRWVTAL